MNKGKVIKISTDEFRYIGLFETLTGAAVKDCIVDGEKVVFIVKEGDMGLAIGKAGINVKKAEAALGKKVDLLEYSRDPVQFVKNILTPAKPKNVYLAQKSTGQKVINIELDQHDKKRLLANGKKNLTELKGYVSRHHPIDDIILA